jgi:cell division transport system permease protein
MRLGFFTREAGRSLRRNAAPSFAALATVLVTMLMVGIFIPIVQAATGAANDVRRRVLVDVFLKTSAKPADATRVRGLLAQSPHAGDVQYVSRAEAYAQQRKRHPELYDLLGKNPLPDTFRVTPDPPDAASALRNDLQGLRDRSVDQVKNRQDDTQKILTVTRVVKITTAGLAAVLVLASILLIANTIRLSLFSRRREVEVMKLVGATDGFIRWPFVIEGLIVGALGSLGAIALLAAFKFAVLNAWAEKFTLIAAPKTIPFGVLVAVILAAGAALSAAGSGLSLRRFLRV